MKPFDDKDLIAYHLHELPPRRAHALRRALAQDPALAAEYDAYAAMLDSFKQAPTFPMDEAVFARNWQAILPSLATHRMAPLRLRWRLPALAGAGLAFAATAFFLTTRPSNQTPTPAVSTTRQPGIAALRVPDTQNSPSKEIHARIGTATPFRPLVAHSHSESGRLIAPIRLPAAPALVPHLIPLAPISPLVLPEAPSTRITMEPESPSQTTTRPRSSRSRRTSLHREHPFDLTFAMGGTLIGTRATGGTDSSTQGATHAVIALAAFHQQLHPFVGYRVAVSYTRPDFQYSHQGTSTSGLNSDLNGRVYELATTYVVQGPHHGAVSTSVEAGAGMMAFLPTQQNYYTSTSNNLRAAAVVGVNAEYALTKHLAIHAAYRAQVFKGPDFNYSGPGAPATASTLFSNEPMLGITYRFHPK
jgi:opacity protein-like surface antigen